MALRRKLLILKRRRVNRCLLSSLDIKYLLMYVAVIQRESATEESGYNQISRIKLNTINNCYK